jgi:mono/diheme cytochrome c family protein
MSNKMAAAQRLIGFLALCACGGAWAQPRDQQPQNQTAPNPQDQAVKMAGRTAGEGSGKTLDEQKSGPVQVVTREYDLERLTHEAPVSDTVFRGRVLWVQKCAFCHDGLGQPTYKTMGPWLDQNLMAALTDDAARIIIQTGTAHMPGFKYGLTSSQLDDLLSFLKTVPASAQPTPAQLAGRSEGGGGD